VASDPGACIQRPGGAEGELGYCHSRAGNSRCISGPDKGTRKSSLQLEIIGSLAISVRAAMSIRLNPRDVIQGPGDDIDSGSCLSSDEDEDQNDPKTWDDWVSDPQETRECYSLFEGKKFASVAKAVEHDEQTHGFNLDRASSKLGQSISFPTQSPLLGPTEIKISLTPALDFHQRVRLINYIRKQVTSLIHNSLL